MKKEKKKKTRERKPREMVECFLKIFMDDFSVFDDSFDDCLTNLEKVLSRYEEKNLVLNWKKISFYGNKRHCTWSHCFIEKN